MGAIAVYPSDVPIGAAGNDITDDTDAIMAQLDSGGASLLPGIYRCNLDVTQPNVALQGSGRGRTILRSASQETQRTIIRWAGEKGSLRDLTIDGELHDLSTTGLKLQGATFFNLSDVEIKYCTRYGLWIHDPSYWSTFAGLLVDGIGSGGSGKEGVGVYVDSQGNALTFTGTHIRGTIEPGLWIRNSQHVTFDGSIQLAGNGPDADWPYGVLVRGACTGIDLDLYTELNGNASPVSADVRVVAEAPGTAPSVRLRGVFDGGGVPAYGVRAENGHVSIGDVSSFMRYRTDVFDVSADIGSFNLVGSINAGWLE